MCYALNTSELRTAGTDLKPTHLETLTTSFEFASTFSDSRNNILVNIAVSKG